MIEIHFYTSNPKTMEGITEVYVTDKQGTKIKAYALTIDWEDVCKHLTGSPPISKEDRK